MYGPPLSGPGVSGGGGGGGGGDPLLDNSNLCDILMLERALGGSPATPDLGAVSAVFDEAYTLLIST